jgi:hypothetical protein
LDTRRIRDEMNRVVFGYAASFDEMAAVVAKALALPA